MSDAASLFPPYLFDTAGTDAPIPAPSGTFTPAVAIAGARRRMRAARTKPARNHWMVWSMTFTVAHGTANPYQFQFDSSYQYRSRETGRRQGGRGADRGGGTP
jgi:hypothetical protein